MTTIRGVDVSAIQGMVPWKEVSDAGISFAYLRCAIGNEPKVDTKFALNAHAAKEAGLLVGPYFFCFPLPHLSPEEQARHHYRLAHVGDHALGENSGELPPACDLEWPAPEDWEKWKCTGAEIADWGIQYLSELYRLFQRKPVVYTYPWFWKKLSEATEKGLERYAEFSLWLASYRTGNVTREQAPKPPFPWDPEQMKLWQHDGNGGLKLPNGVDADFNVFCGTPFEFEHFVDGASIDTTLAKDEQARILVDEDVAAYRRDRDNAES